MGLTNYAPARAGRFRAGGNCGDAAASARTTRPSVLARSEEATMTEPRRVDDIAGLRQLVGETLGKVDGFQQAGTRSRHPLMPRWPTIRSTSNGLM